MALDGKQLKPGSVTVAKIDISGASTSTDPASRGYVQGLIDASVYNRDVKDSVRAATTTNITLSGLQTLDGVSMNAGERALVKNQTNPAQNGPYIVGTGAWTRTPDADSSAEVTSMMIVPVEEGTTQAGTTWKLTTTGSITLGTTGLTFSLFSTTYYATPTTGNKSMAAVATTNDNDVACNTGLAATPASNSYVKVEVNGVGIDVGSGVKTKEAYFSADSGTTAKALNALASGDKLYWVGSVAGYQLASTDRVDFFFNV